MTKPDLKHNNSYIPGIDGLRAIAVLAVILYHIKSSFLPGGFSGVDVFFVISGYVVSASLARDAKSDLIRFALNFYARRIIRIFPALVVCLVTISVMTTLIVPSSWLSDTSPRTALAAFFGWSNIALIRYSDGYFSPRIEFNPFAHTWSLGVEEQFYVIFPIVLFIWLRHNEKKGVLGIFANWTLVLLLTLSFFYSFFETSANQDKAFYLLPSRFWELACGALLFILHKQNKLLPRSAANARICLTIGLILIGLGFVFSDQKSFPFPWAILSVGGTLFLIAAAVNRDESRAKLQNIIDNPIIVYVGKTSYSLYLWHWPVYVLFRWTVGLNSPLAAASAVLLTATLANISYHYLEVPIRKNHYVRAKVNWQIISGGIAIILLSFVLSKMIFLGQSKLSLSVTKDKHTWYPLSWPSPVNSGKASQGLFTGRKIFIMGDSHAGAYSTMLRELADEHGVEVHQYLKGGCAAANLLKPSSADCAQYIQTALSDIEKQARPNDVIFLASLRMNRLGDQWETFDEAKIVNKQLSTDASSKRAIALEEAEHLVGRLEKKFTRILIDAPAPIFKSPPFRCSDWFNAGNPVCSSGFTMERDFLLKYREPAMDSLETLARNHPKLVVWDPFPILCPDDTCSAFDNNNRPLFFDGDHLSAHGNRVLYPSFLSLLQTIWTNRDGVNVAVR